MYSTIVVPIDLGRPELGRRTLITARETGGAQCRIVALYVAEGVPSFITSELPAAARGQSLRAAEAALVALADEVGAEAAVRSGYPPLKIVEVADSIGADLIIIDSHRFELEDYLLGSPAARVVRLAHCPVLVCPPAEASEDWAV